MKAGVDKIVPKKIKYKIKTPHSLNGPSFLKRYMKQNNRGDIQIVKIQTLSGYKTNLCFSDKCF